MYTTILAIGLMIFTAHLFTALNEKTKIPDVLLLMIVGILVGPVFQLVTADYFGQFGLVITTIALIVILFDGGSHLSIASLRMAFSGTILLSLTTFFLTMTIGALAAKYLIGVNTVSALMIGAMIAPISPAVVLPMISALRMDEKSRTILILETAITDVLGIILAFAFIESAKSGELDLGPLVLQIVKSSTVSMLIGLLGGAAWSLLLSRIRRFPNSVFTTFAMIFILYGLTEQFHFSGPLTALAFGFAISNIDAIDRSSHPWIAKIAANNSFEDFSKKENSFFSEIQFLLKIFFFVFLGISFPLDQWAYLLWGIGISAVLFMMRVLVLRLTVKRDIPTRSAAIMAIMIPKGLASAVLAAIPLQQGLQYGLEIQNTVFAIILWTISITSIWVILVEKTSAKQMMVRWIGMKREQLDEELATDPLMEKIKTASGEPIPPSVADSDQV